MRREKGKRDSPAASVEQKGKVNGDSVLPEGGERKGEKRASLQPAEKCESPKKRKKGVD